MRNGRCIIDGSARAIDTKTAAGSGCAVGDRFSVADPYLLAIHRRGVRIGIDMAVLYRASHAHAPRLGERPAMQRALDQEGLTPMGV